MFAQLVNQEIIKNLKFTAFKKEQPHVGGGVYRMFDSKDKIVYVGKSNDVTRRIKQHLSGTTNTKRFIHEVKHIDYHRNNSPILQTLLEGCLIAFHRPKHNDEVRDEKAQKHKKKS